MFSFTYICEAFNEVEKSEMKKTLVSLIQC